MGKVEREFTLLVIGDEFLLQEEEFRCVREEREYLPVGSLL